MRRAHPPVQHPAQGLTREAGEARPAHPLVRTHLTHPLVRQLRRRATLSLSALLLLGTAAAQGSGEVASASNGTVASTPNGTQAPATGTPFTPSLPAGVPLPLPPSPLPATQAAPLQPAPLTPVQLIAPVLPQPQPQVQPQPQAQPQPVSPAPTNPDGTITLPGTADQGAGPDAGAGLEGSSVPHAVDLTLSVPDNASQTLLVQPLPAGVTYVPGSVTLGGQGAPEPRLLGSTLYFIFGGAASGQLHYTVTAPEGPLTLALGGLGVRYPQGQTEVLQGALSFEEAGRAAAITAAPAERGGVIRSPADNTELRGSHSVNVTVDVPAGVSPANVLSVNGVPVPRARVGQTLSYADGHTRLVYIAVPLREGSNELSALGDRVRVRTGAPAARVLVVPARGNVADGSTPLEFTLDVRDAAGNATDLPGVAVSVVGGELLEAARDTATGNTTTAGTIIPVVNGVGQLRLRPMSTPGVVTLIFDVNGHPQQERFAVSGDRGRFYVARGGVTLSGGQLSGSAAGTLETPLLGGKLYAAANTAGVNAQPLPYARSTTYGDASSASQPLSATGPLAARLELPGLHAEYLQDAAYDPVFGVHTGADGLNVETRGDRRYGAGVTALPGDLKTVTLLPDGTRLLQLPDTGAVPNSETLELVLTLGGVEVSRRTLARNSDYVLGGNGLIEFPAPLLPVTPSGQLVSVVAHYRSGAGGTGSYTFGAHATQDFRLPALGDAAGSVSAGFISQGGVLAVGARALMVGPSVAADVLAGYSGGGLLVQGSALYKAGPVAAAVIARSQDAAYLGPQGSSAGAALSATATYQLGAQFGVKVAAQYARAPLSSTVNGVTTTSDTVNTAAVGAGLTYDRLGRDNALHAELLARRNFLDGGLFGVAGTLGYTDIVNSVLVNQVQDFGGGQSVTTLSATRRVSQTLRFGVTAVHDWVAGTTSAGLVLTGTRAGMTYVAGYDLPTGGASLGSARLAASTSVALRPGLSADAAASAFTQEGVPGVSVGGTLRYVRDTVQASLGSDLSVSGNAATLDVKSALNFAVNSRLTLALDGLSQFGDASVTGSRYGVSLAWRGELNDAIGYLRFRSGAFGEDRVTGELDLTQHPDIQRADRDGRPAHRSYQPLELRESLDAAYPLTGVAPTVLGQVGARYWVSERFALGAVGGALWQQGSPLGTRLGLEATVSPLTGLGITAGYNFSGFANDLGRQSTRPGFYLQLDLLLDEARK